MGEAKRRRERGQAPLSNATEDYITVGFAVSDDSPAPPNPQFPDGVNLDTTAGEPVQSCMVNVPYPAPSNGVWEVRCRRCGMGIGVPVTGQASDVRTLRMACKAQAGATGRFPETPTRRPQDMGGLAVSVSAPDADGNVYIDFGKPVEWISLPQRQVVEMCLTMLNRVGVQVNIEVLNTSDTKPS